MTTRPVSVAGQTWVGVVTCAEGGQQQARRTSDAQTRPTATSTDKVTEKGEKLKDEMDALIDEIDEVLEENAEEFVKNYVQRGGE
jgi:ubiquitin-like protein Pup